MLPSPHFWFTGSAFFTIGSFALFAVLGFVGIASMTVKYRKLMISGYVTAVILFSIGWLQAARQEEAAADTQSLLNKIANSADVSLNQSANEIAEAVIKKLEPLERQVDKLSNPPRENDTLYQDNKSIGRVAGISLDDAKTIASFQAVTSERQLDFSKDMELQGARLSCSSTRGPASIMSFGAAQTFTYVDVICKVLGAR
jgi:hypothetical protein